MDQTPEWWRDRLFKQLQSRLPAWRRYHRYYEGRCDLPWIADDARDDFERMLQLTKSNFMGLVVDAMVEREVIEGFRLDANAEKADEATWAMWQAANMDSSSDLVILESAIGGAGYASATPNRRDLSNPHIQPESAGQTIIAYAPGTGRRERIAALKAWTDEWTGDIHSTLYTPRNLFKWAAKSDRVLSEDGTPATSLSGQTPSWVEREVDGEEYGVRNPLGVVPIVEIPNNPRLLTGGVSEIDDVIPIQDRISKTLADRLMSQDWGAFPQKWASGYPEKDAAGNPNPKIRVGRDRMVTTDVAEAKFGQWEAAALDPYSAAKAEDVKDIASRTRTPPQYLLGTMVNVSGDALKAAESGLVSKVRQRQRHHGEGFEELMRVARLAAGIGGGDAGMQVIWRNPEFRTEGELTDALVKMSTIGVPQEALWERWGATPQEIARWKVLRDEQQADAVSRLLAGDLTKPPVPDRSADGGAPPKDAQ